MKSKRRWLLTIAGLSAAEFLGCLCWPDGSANAAASTQAISIGDSADQVRQALGVTTPLVPGNNSTPGSQALPQMDRGLVVFFDSSNKVYRIRLDQPFASAVCGARLGEQRQKILAALGPPEQTLPNRAFPDRASYIYACDSSLSVRYDFTSDDRLSGIFILSGSIPVPPIVAASTNAAAESGAEAIRSAVDQSRNSAGRQHLAAGLQAAGQLAPTHDLSCMPVEQVRPAYTAADLYRAARKCLDGDRFELGAQLFTLAGTYGRFDIQRITDKSVSGGLSILMMDAGDGLTDAQKQGFLAAAKALQDDPRKHSEFCARVAAVGPPDYIPVYLTSHGAGVPDGRRSDKNGLDPDFARAGSWARLLSDGLRCPAR